MVTIKKKFIRIPRKYVQCDIEKEYGIGRKFYITYIFIDRYRTIENHSWVTIGKILSYYNFKPSRNRPKAFYDVVRALKFMVENRMIQVNQDLDALYYDTGIEIDVIPEYFDVQREWSALYTDDFDRIMQGDSDTKKDLLLLSYLYVNSYINTRQANHITDKSKSPEAFYKNLSSMANDLSMSKGSVSKCLKELVSKNLLVRETVGSLKQNNNKSRNVPNIYVLNKEGHEQEIQWALQKLKDIYQVGKFDEPKGQQNTKNGGTQNMNSLQEEIINL